MEDIYLEIYDVLLFRAASITGNSDDAKDIVQDLYLRLKAQETRQLPLANPRGYLYGMVSNMAKMFLRNEIRHRELEQQLASTSVVEPRTNYIDDLLAPLSQLQRVVVGLHDIEGYTCVEIAIRLSKSPSAVRKQLSLAHRRL